MLAIISAGLVPVVLARLPADHFCVVHGPRRFNFAWNAAGALLLLLGVLMLFTPGQGVLTAIAGLSLLDFPGRHDLIIRLLSRPTVRRATDSLRARRGQPPLLLLPGEE
ncbi:MAG: hypothetical protein ACI8S6_001386 [Myxococcota bacterium]